MMMVVVTPWQALVDSPPKNKDKSINQKEVLGLLSTLSLVLMCKLVLKGHPKCIKEEKKLIFSSLYFFSMQPAFL